MKQIIVASLLLLMFTPGLWADTKAGKVETAPLKMTGMRSGELGSVSTGALKMTGMRSGKLGSISAGALKMTGMGFAPREKAVLEVKQITTTPLEMTGTRAVRIQKVTVSELPKQRDGSLERTVPVSPTRARTGAGEEDVDSTDIR